MVFVPAVGAKTVDSKTEEVGPFSGIEMPEELKKNVVQVDPYTFVFKGEINDKEALYAAWDDYEEKVLSKNQVSVTQSNNVDGNAVTTTTSTSGTDTARRNLLGSYIKGDTYFHGTMETGLTIPVTFTGDGYTKGRWYGTGNPNKIKLGSDVKITGVSVSISYPSGAGFSLSGDTVTYSGEWNNVAGAQHYYDNLKATSWVSITDQDQNDAETFRFGTSDYTLYTHVDL
ncbi:hypothetical protein [Methanosarcina mazei]|nr:hypothetical protein [Methanosarcina mazei]KKG79468.1 hypothetical protein DU55_17555 [Methanosarcina mazei]KKG94129.1 hypothetical protein DU69_08925 [Methanosarcina mazei]